MVSKRYLSSISCLSEKDSSVGSILFLNHDKFTSFGNGGDDLGEYFDNYYSFGNLDNGNSLDTLISDYDYNIKDNPSYFDLSIQINPLQTRVCELFPTLSDTVKENIYRVLGITLKKFDENPLQTKDPITCTGSDTVFNFFEDQEDGTKKKVYCKVSQNVEKLEKEYEVYQDAWSSSNDGIVGSLVRLVMQKPVDLIKGEGFASLITYDTNLLGSEDISAVCTYFNLLHNLTKEYALNNNLNLQELLEDKFVQDVFNRAITHVGLRKFRNKEIYNNPDNQRPAVITFDELCDRAHLTIAQDTFEDMQLRKKLYQKLATQYANLEQLGDEHLTLVNGDARQGNIFTNGLGLRPLGDFGDVKADMPYADLAKLESPNNAAYVNFYAFIVNKLEEMKGSDYRVDSRAEEIIRQHVKVLSPLNALRAGSFKLMKNLRDDALYYNKLFDCYVGGRLDERIFSHSMM